MQDSWIWNHVAPSRIALHTIDPAELEPSATPVTKGSKDELVCSYNWLKGDGLAIMIPGTWTVLSFRAITDLICRVRPDVEAARLARHSPSGQGLLQCRFERSPHAAVPV